MSNGIFQRYDDWFLKGSTVSGTAPQTTYALADLLTLMPAARVLWPAGAVSITFTLAGAKQGDIFALPMHNLDAGSTITLTNGAGLSQSIVVPAYQLDGLPPTIVINLTTGTPVAATRTSTTWTLSIASNSVPVCLGACVWISGPLRTLDRNPDWSSIHEQEQHAVVIHDNAWLVSRRLNLRAKIRSYECQVSASDTGRDDLRSWYQSTAGGALLSLFWPDPGVGDAYLGYFSNPLDVQRTFLNLNTIKWTFTEASKGVALS